MAVPDYIFTEGWDKYGPVNTALVSRTQNTSLWVDEWRTLTGGDTHTILAPLTGTVTNHGSYRQKASNSGNSPAQALKTLPGNYARVVGGFTFNSMDAFSQSGLTFVDVPNSVNQFTIQLNMTTAKIEVRRGWRGGTLIATSTQTWSVGTTHCLEYDITFHATAGIIKIWLDGALTSINLTGQNTISNINAYFNGIDLGTINTNNHAAWWDHFYLWAFTASGGSETPCLDNPIIETSQAQADDTVAWTVGAHAFTSPNYYWGPGNIGTQPGGNQILLRRCVADQSGTITNVVVSQPNTTSAICKVKAVIYADSSGAPGALLATGTEVIGVTSGTPLVLPISYAATGGTTYWIGMIYDQVINWGCNDDSGSGLAKGNTYTSGPPNPAGTGFGTVGNVNLVMTMTGVTLHYPQENVWRPLQDYSYNVSGTLNQKDLYTFPALTATPTAIHCVSVKGMLARSDSGLRGARFYVKSGVTVSYGTSGDIIPPITWGMEGSNWFNDPATSAAWATAAVNAAKFGYEITV